MFRLSDLKDRPTIPAGSIGSPRRERRVDDKRPRLSASGGSVQVRQARAIRSATGWQPAFCTAHGPACARCRGSRCSRVARRPRRRSARVRTPDRVGCASERRRRPIRSAPPPDRGSGRGRDGHRRVWRRNRSHPVASAQPGPVFGRAPIRCRRQRLLAGVERLLDPGLGVVLTRETKKVLGRFAEQLGTVHSELFSQRCAGAVSASSTRKLASNRRREPASGQSSSFAPRQGSRWRRPPCRRPRPPPAR
jgi:hypothetical protein